MWKNRIVCRSLWCVWVDAAAAAACSSPPTNKKKKAKIIVIERMMNDKHISLSTSDVKLDALKFRMLFSIFVEQVFFHFIFREDQK